MADLFPILYFSADEMERDETLGTKVKFWFKQNGERWLFKEARENTGEDWSEKLAAEIAQLMGIDAATVELAEYNGTRGSASLKFLNPAEGEGLIHGNEILAGHVKGYDAGKTYKQSSHTLENIQNAVAKLLPDSEIYDVVLKQLAGYLVLDALVGNTDRHHENWGMILTQRQGLLSDDLSLRLRVAPTFDHASSLGRELRDEKRSNFLHSQGVERYVRKGRGAIFFSPEDAHGANPLRLVEFGARRFEQYFQPNMKRLELFSVADLDLLVDRVPDERMSELAKAFAKTFLAYTYESLCKLIK
jgi:hypothetical protein